MQYLETTYILFKLPYEARYNQHAMKHDIKRLEQIGFSFFKTRTSWCILNRYDFYFCENINLNGHFQWKDLFLIPEKSICKLKE